MKVHRWEITCDLCKRAMTEQTTSTIVLQGVPHTVHDTRHVVELDVCVDCFSERISELWIAAGRILCPPGENTP
jgi:hypothetical protein